MLHFKMWPALDIGPEPDQLEASTGIADSCIVSLSAIDTGLGVRNLTNGKNPDFPSGILFARMDSHHVTLYDLTQIHVFYENPYRFSQFWWWESSWEFLVSGRISDPA